MKNRLFDLGTIVIISITLLLFVLALFEKGFTHDMLLEAGVFLVSVKLIMMSYTNSLATRDMRDQLDAIQQALARLESERTTQE
jgi:hypothetical protein